MEIAKLVYDFLDKYVTLHISSELDELWRQIGAAINAALTE